MPARLGRIDLVQVVPWEGLGVARRRYEVAETICRLAGRDVARVVDARDGWPSLVEVYVADRWLQVAMFAAPIGLSSRKREAVERRFQNPGQERPMVSPPGHVPMFVALWDEDPEVEVEHPVLVTAEVAGRADNVTRFSLFPRLAQLQIAARDGWADSLTTSEEQLTYLWPQLLPTAVGAIAELDLPPSGTTPEQAGDFEDPDGVDDVPDQEDDRDHSGGGFLSAVEFQPYRRSIEELLTSPDYYLIPRFQRPYSWDLGNVDEFWRDVIEDNPAGYFIGPMVAWRQGLSPKLSVIDGQQRLTTITIFLAALRDEFARLGNKRLAMGVHRYIEHADRDNELQYTLQSEATSAFLNNAILPGTPDPRTTPRSDEERALQRAHKEIRRKISAALADTMMTAEAWLRDTRDKILALRVIWVEHGREDDAYTVFETLNSRGKDLEVVDLLKNHLLNRLRRGANRSSDPYRDRWAQVRTIIAESDAGINVNSFLLHWWLSQEKYVSQRRLFSAMKAAISTRTAALERLESLENDAPLYREIFDPWKLNWGPEERDIPDALSALAIFKMSQPAPFLLALLRARLNSGNRLMAKHAIRTARTIEAFHFQYTAISGLSSSGGVSEMYAKYARELTSARDGSAQYAAVRGLQDALVRRKPDRETFIAAFTEKLVLTNEITRDKKLVQYVLRQLLKADRPRTESQSLTVEHILPQESIGTSAELVAEVVGSIGNLLLVDEELNGRLGSKDFRTKRGILEKVQTSYPVGDVVAATRWGPAEIKARAAKMAGDAYDRVWQLPV